MGQLRSAGGMLAILMVASPVFAQVPPVNKPAGAPTAVQQLAPADDKSPPLPAVNPPVDPNTYKIGTADVIEVKVWREPELSGSYRVRPDGKITLPLVGDVQAADVTPAELKQKCTEAFGAVLNTPQVYVAVLAVESKKYWVLGQGAGRPGPFPLVTPTTVLDAMSMCGMGEWAKKGSIVIVRGKERIKFNYNQVIKGKHLEQNIFLQNDDHIIVP